MQLEETYMNEKIFAKDTVPTVLAIIPARGGSKGLPGKNIKMLNSKPLVAWAIERANSCQEITDAIVSTDSTEIASIAEKYGGNVPFIRPAEFAQDTSSALDVILHAIDFMKKEKRKEYDYILWLEPTSPLREFDDLSTMIKKLHALRDQYDGIVSMGEVRHHPGLLFEIENNNIVKFAKDLPLSRRQDYKPVYFPYGVGYLTKTATIFKEQTVYPKRTTYHLIKNHQCFEIDDLYDFLMIELIMQREQIK